MEFLKDRRVVVGGGIAAALIAGLLFALAVGAGKKAPQAPPPASQGGLVVEVGHDDVKLDPSRKLACYVNGQSVGMTTLAECAAKNGISSGQLDVGLDQSGEMAFGDVGAALAPLPPSAATVATATPVPTPIPAPAPAATTPAVATVIDRGPVAACWRYAERTWLKMSDLPLAACAAALFDGHCERAGQATYGRWGEQTLRLVPGRIEQSSDNRTFRTLVEQGPNCSLPPFQ